MQGNTFDWLENINDAKQNLFKKSQDVPLDTCTLSRNLEKLI